MAFEGITSDSALERTARKIERRKSDRQIDWVEIEQRRSFRDELSDLRFGSIDYLPKEKITHDDPNNSRYKCKSNWMFRLNFKLGEAVRTGVLSTLEEIKAAKDFENFLMNRRKVQQTDFASRVTPAEMTELQRIGVEEGPAALQKMISQRFWVPTTQAEIDFINQTLDILIGSLAHTPAQRRIKNVLRH
ncbi:MAG: hypothetical protein NT003_02635 [Candidatus Magasanikbacteria bacterium]|nr:hypothetical protein [Candidatus Magasanikbacteria bacterium]